ncbi:hypothetical protein CL6EHI_c00039 [Entamoeba histolytica]|uniref:Uncharacterized protein n=1 Tax=Entamoeba histolytica TaxID=5759 RepID=A0A175JFQ0_ENTHI|nr:hypothetical protein CL6EHI_c00039 [Entamoeba histolytica]
MALTDIFITITDLVFLYFASLLDFSGQVEYRHPQIGNGNRTHNPEGGHRLGSIQNTQVHHIPVTGCAGCN